MIAGSDGMTVLAAVIALLGASAAPLRGQEQVERFPNGKIQRSFRVDADGNRHGPYIEYYESGVVRLRCRYSHGKFDERYESFRPDGRRECERTYVDGNVTSLDRYGEDGEPFHSIRSRNGKLVLVCKDAPDIDLFPKSLDRIRTDLARVDVDAGIAPGDWYDLKPSVGEPRTAGSVKSSAAQDAARRANAYRYLAGLPSSLEIGGEQADLAQHAALVSALNGEISHTPRRPEGLPASIFDRAAQGAAQSNLHAGQSTLRRAVDGFMDDSDPRNIRAVGHRRCILSPGLKFTGFGIVDGFIAMHVHDSSERAPRPLTLAFPGPGLHPVDYIAGPHVAWHYGWDESRVRVAPGRTPTVRLTRLDDAFDLAEPIEVSNLAVDDGGVAGMPALIFRPVLAADQFRPGLRVFVEVQGLLLPKKMVPTYVVELAPPFRTK